MNDTAGSARRPKRCWLQFSLRTIGIVFTGLCVWLGFETNAANRQRRAVEGIRSSGGFVHFSHQYNQWGGFDPAATPPGPEWLRNLIGDDYFIRVDLVHLRNQANALPHVESLPHIRHLLAQGHDVGDRELEHVRGLTCLVELNLDGTLVGDDGLARLRGLEGLETLSLDDARITDAGLEHLRCLTSLRHLYLGGNRITDAGLDHLKDLPRLERLYLYNTQVSNAGLAHLKAIPSLRAVELHHTQVTDEGLAEFKRDMPRVKWAVR